MVKMVVKDKVNQVVVKVTLEQALTMKQIYTQLGLEVVVYGYETFGKVIVK